MEGVSEPNCIVGLSTYIYGQTEYYAMSDITRVMQAYICRVCTITIIERAQNCALTAGRQTGCIGTPKYMEYNTFLLQYVYILRKISVSMKV